MQKEIIVKDLNELNQAASEILAFTKDETKFALYGEMGAGKTTLVKEICKELGTEDIANSPSGLPVLWMIVRERQTYFLFDCEPPTFLLSDYYI